VLNPPVLNQHPPAFPGRFKPLIPRRCSTGESPSNIPTIRQVPDSNSN
jgi:hypothetical protein